MRLPLFERSKASAGIHRLDRVLGTTHGAGSRQTGDNQQKAMLTLLPRCRSILNSQQTTRPMQCKRHHPRQETSFRTNHCAIKGRLQGETLNNLLKLLWVVSRSHHLFSAFAVASTLNDSIGCVSRVTNKNQVLQESEEVHMRLMCMHVTRVCLARGH